MTDRISSAKTGAMKAPVLIVAMMAIAPSLVCAQTDNADPASIDVVDAIECRLDAPAYNGFAFALEGEEQIARKRKWFKVPSTNPMMHEYQLPAAITVAEHYTTRRIALTSSGILAILDLPDPAPFAQTLGIENAANTEALMAALGAEGPVPAEMADAARRSGKFLGEKIVSETTETATPENRFGAHTVISLNVSTVRSHPGKTLYGCAYRMTLLDQDGNPL